MNGAELLVKTALQAGVRHCFANPGTTELPLVVALDTVPGMKAVLGLFEGVCTGAADGYARMLDRPAMVLLHLGPGLSNGLSNLHNARRASSPVLNVVGEHATWHRILDPPLAMDIESLANTVSSWQRTCTKTDEIAIDTADAISAALMGKVATLIIPYDLQLKTSTASEPATTIPASDPVETGPINTAATLLKSGKKCALVLGGTALREKALFHAARIRTGVGCDLLAENFPARMERGAGLPDLIRIPYLPEMALDMLSRYEVFIFAGAREPISFFGYEGIPGPLLRDNQKRLRIDHGRHDMEDVLQALAEAVSAPHSPAKVHLAPLKRPEIPSGELTGDKICSVIAALQTDNAIVVEEAITNSLMYYPLSSGAPPHSLLTLTGGSLGQGPPCAVGAAFACPDRHVISYQADGATLYTLQALGTQAKESLNVITLVCANNRYDILKLEMTRLGVFEPAVNSAHLMDLGRVDWVKIGEGFGIPSVSVRTAEDLAREFKRSLEAQGPNLIEMVLY
ncbi:MAG: acetolactate synthase large subunit [Desulfomonilia bacterium]